MRGTLRRAWLPLLGAGALLVGCEQSRSSRCPPDPLLLSKKPVESRHDSVAPPLVARREPRVPESLITELGPHPSDSAVPTSLRDEGAER